MCSGLMFHSLESSVVIFMFIPFRSMISYLEIYPQIMRDVYMNLYKAIFMVFVEIIKD